MLNNSNGVCSGFGAAVTVTLNVVEASMLSPRASTFAAPSASANKTSFALICTNSPPSTIINVKVSTLVTGSNVTTNTSQQPHLQLM